MANVTNKNPYDIDTTGAIATEQVMLHSAVIYPTAGSWVCKLLTEAGGDLVLEAAGADANSIQIIFPEEYRKKLYAQTLTNCTVQLYLK